MMEMYTGQYRSFNKIQSKIEMVSHAWILENFSREDNLQFLNFLNF